MSILAVGTVALDSVKTPFGRRDEILGGSATFFSVAASFFSKVNVIAVVGKDFPKKYIALLKNRGIGTDGISVADGKTFRWRGYYGNDLNTAHTLSTCLNVFENFRPMVPAPLANSELVFLANADPGLQYDVLRQMKAPRLVAADSMNYWIENRKKALEKLLKKLDIFLVNDSEARQFSGESNILKAAKAILSFGPRSVVIKRGEYGVIYFSKDFAFSLPAYILETLRDPTGAGDTFAGGMIGYLGSVRKINGSTMRRAVAYGSILASFAVEDFSIDRLIAINSRDIANRYRQFKNMTEF